MAARRDTHHACRGHTLIELVVVGTIMSIVMMIAMRATRPLSASALHLRDRAVASSELRLAVEALLSDLGGAERIVRENSSTLRIVREREVARLAGAWKNGRDDGVVYTLSKGRLLRSDLSLRTRVVMAVGLEGFLIDHERGLGTTITLDTGQGEGAARALTLVWPG